MSAGALPRLQKTEPWELIQAFAEAMDRDTLQKADLRNRQDIQAMKEAGDDRRLERGSQLAIDRLSKELALKEPYEQRTAERSHGYDIEKLNRGGEITRENYKAYGAESERQHKSNRTFDIEQDLQYGPAQREAKKADLLAKEDIDKLAQQRKNEIDRQDAFERDRYLREKRPDDLQYESDKERQRQGITTDEAVKRAERMTPTLIERDKARQDAIGARRQSEAEIKNKAAEKKEQDKRDTAVAMQQMRGDQAMARVHARQMQKTGMVRLPNGLIGVDPRKMLEYKMGGVVDFEDPSQFERVGVDQNPFDPKQGIMMFYRPTNPANINDQLLNMMTPQGQSGGGPAEQGPVYQDLPPQRPPETVAPAIPVTPPPPSTEGTGKGNPLEQLRRGLEGGGRPSSDFGVDDLRRGGQSSIQPSSPLDQLRQMVATADPALRLQYASFREPTSSIAEPRPQFEPDKIPTTIGRTTTVEKGVQADNSLRGPVVPDIAAPVTTGSPEPVENTDQGPLSYAPKTTDEQGRPREISPDRMGTWRRTAAEAHPELRDIFDRVGKQYNISPDLLAAQSHQESRWNPNAVSPVGAVGISQFMPKTAQEYNLADRRDPAASIDAQARYMQKMLAKYNGNLGLALIAYNGGPGRANQFAAGQESRIPAKAKAQMVGYVQSITGRPASWWLARYKQGGTQTAGMTQRDVPLPPSRPGDLEGGTSVVAQNEPGDQQQPEQTDQELPLQNAPLQERPPISQLPARRPPDLPQQTEVEGTTLRGLPLESGATRQDTRGFVFHHTGDRDPQGRPIKTVQDVTRVLQNRGLGSQYIMDRDGTIHQMSGDESRQSHIKPGQGIGRGLSDDNTIGLEILAANDADVTPAQRQSARNFYAKMEKLYPNIRAYSHGEINPHKQSTEGATVVKDLRDEYRRQQKLPKMHKTENPDLFYVDV